MWDTQLWLSLKKEEKTCVFRTLKYHFSKLVQIRNWACPDRRLSRSESFTVHDNLIHILLIRCVCTKYLPPPGNIHLARTRQWKWWTPDVQDLGWFLCCLSCLIICYSRLTVGVSCTSLAHHSITQSLTHNLPHKDLADWLTFLPAFLSMGWNLFGINPWH